MTKKYELLEEEFVIAKAKWTSETEDMQKQHDNLREDYATIQRELSTLRGTYNLKVTAYGPLIEGTKSFIMPHFQADDWIKEKLELQRSVRDLEDSIRNSAGGEGWEVERERFKHIIEDRDNQVRTEE